MAAPRNANIKQTILATALQLLQTTSFADISLAQIAQAAGISKGTLYYYYNSKDDILCDITESYLTHLAGDLLSWVDNKEKDTRPERLFNYVLRRGAASTFGNLRLYLIGAAVSGDTLVRDRFVERYDYFQTTLTAKIAERLPNADSNYLAWLLLTTMDGMLVQVQLRSPGFDFDSFVNKTVQILQQTVALMVPQK